MLHPHAKRIGRKEGERRSSNINKPQLWAYPHSFFPSSPDNGESVDLSLCLACPPHMLFSICPATFCGIFKKVFPWEWPWAISLLLFQQACLSNMFLLVRPHTFFPTLLYLIFFCWRSSCIPWGRVQPVADPHPYQIISALTSRMRESSLHGSTSTLLRLPISRGSDDWIFFLMLTTDLSHSKAGNAIRQRMILGRTATNGLAFCVPHKHLIYPSTLPASCI